MSPLPSQYDHNQSTKTPSSKRYEVQFFSLKRGHKICSSYFDLNDQEVFEVTIPSENFFKTKGNYTKKGLQFNASWEGTIIKKNKHFSYAFTINGISLLDSYIAGIMILNEHIKEANHDQEISFLFIGTAEGKNDSKGNIRDLFPF
jgi:hypothetical protein